MDQVPNIPNINEYNEHFRQTAPLIKNQPRSDRDCNDKCCYVLFILLTLLFIGAGVFFIINADFASLSKMDTTTNSTRSSTTEKEAYDISNLKPGIPVIIGMCVFAVILAVLFLCLILKFPKCMFYTMLAVGAILILALAIILFVSQQVVGGAIFLVIFFVYLLAIYCSRDKIRIGSVLLQTAAKFVAEKPTIFLAPFVVLLLLAGFQLFWIVSFVAITLYGGLEKNDTQRQNQQNISGVFMIIWGFLQLFFSFFFHYCIVFLIATAAAMWYYNVDGNYLCTSLKRIVSNHLGSFTFAALIMAIVTMARQASENQRNQSQGGAAAVCTCLLVCCLRAIQDLVEVLNHNAIIVMAVTGESYIDSAKSAISLIFDNFLLFFLIDMVSSLVKLSGIIFISAIPGIIGFFLLKATAQNPDDTQFLTYGTCIIVIISMLIGVIFLSVLSQALSCVFIFFCLDRKFTQLGYPAPQNTPAPMRQLFSDLARSSGIATNSDVNPPRNTYNPNNQGNPYNSGNPYQSGRQNSYQPMHPSGNNNPGYNNGPGYY